MLGVAGIIAYLVVPSRHQRVVGGAGLARNITRALGPETHGVVSCPFEAVRAGLVFSCTVRMTTGVEAVRVTELDAKGTVTFSRPGPPTGAG